MSGITFERPGLHNSTHDGTALVSSKRLGFVLYIGLTLMLFGGLFTGWLVLRGTNADWPPPSAPSFSFLQILPHTILIILTTLFMYSAHVQARKADYEKFRTWVFYSLLGSILFLFACGMEWYRLIAGGLRMDGVFGSIYFLLAGTFIAHYIGGVIAQVLFIRRTATIALVLEKNAGFRNSLNWHYLMLLIWCAIVFVAYIM